MEEGEEEEEEGLPRKVSDFSTMQGFIHLGLASYPSLFLSLPPSLLPSQSYHDTLLQDRTYHNPHALEGMAAVYGLLPAQRQHRSFLLPSPPPPPQAGRPFYCEGIRNLQNK